MRIQDLLALKDTVFRKIGSRKQKFSTKSKTIVDTVPRREISVWIYHETTNIVEAVTRPVQVDDFAEMVTVDAFRAMFYVQMDVQSWEAILVTVENAKMHVKKTNIALAENV